jgi:hypothetical protein
MERHPVIAETPAICTFPLSVKGIDKWILCMVFVIICVVVYVILQACLYIIGKRANFRLTDFLSNQLRPTAAGNGHTPDRANPSPVRNNSPLLSRSARGRPATPAVPISGVYGD